MAKYTLIITTTDADLIEKTKDAINSFPNPGDFIIVRNPNYSPNNLEGRANCLILIGYLINSNNNKTKKICSVSKDFSDVMHSITSIIF